MLCTTTTTPFGRGELGGEEELEAKLDFVAFAFRGEFSTGVAREAAVEERSRIGQPRVHFWSWSMKGGERGRASSRSAYNGKKNPDKQFPSVI